MNPTLITIGVVILAIIAGLWAFGRRERRAGQDEVRADVAVEVVDTMKAQDKAAAEAKSEAVVDRLRKGGF